MSLYESVFIARPNLSGPQVDKLAERFVEIIKDNGGKVEKVESWGLRSLAYAIKKNKKGHYVLLNIDAPAAALTEMERNMRINEDIIRHMSVAVDALDASPAKILETKYGKDSYNREGRRPRHDAPESEATEGDLA